MKLNSQLDHTEPKKKMPAKKFIHNNNNWQQKPQKIKVYLQNVKNGEKKN